MPSYRYKQRKSPRLQGYDYSQHGLYFVTICAYKMSRWFGSIEQCKMHYHAMGNIALDGWLDLPNHYPDIALDVFVIMPNHVHGIVGLAGGGAALGTVIGSYKAAVTRRIRKECVGFPITIWHGRYHDHIIRNAQELERIQTYIRDNPARWDQDSYFRS